MNIYFFVFRFFCCCTVSPAYQNQYCVWTLAPRDSTALVLLFNRFSMFGSKIDIYSGSVSTGTYMFTIRDTDSIPSPLLFSNQIISVVYTSSVSNVTSSGLGFSLTYYGISNKILSPGNGMTVITSAGMLSLSLTLFSAITIINSYSSPPTVSTSFQPVSTIKGYVNATWLLKPTTSSGMLIIAFSYLNLTCPNNYLEIHDGNTLLSPIIGRYCGGTYYSINSKYKAQLQPPTYSWIQTSGNVAILNLISDNKQSFRNFEISFYSDGPAVRI